ncbi:hypothetical protein D6851_01460 [Altericroceibacterium spongiae]|uniref:Uncharacterized protein n=1 Tax=Altericroceibacterium spongiae TaxID=2320269 RepID=A0A420ER76_9SPHN|nr:hypothetical protein [Altericroceibacterium spongiae]RKF23185.1 hypothetical protein D6851_01460 [Altericroceibacterium spongiae]
MIRKACLAALIFWTVSGCSENGQSYTDSVVETGGDNAAAEAAHEDTALNTGPDQGVEHDGATGQRAECSVDEEPLFACPLENGKKVAVCLVDRPDGQSFVQYRYGEACKTAELAWPEKPGTEQLRFASTPYSGGGEAQLSFARGHTRYVIYSRVVRTNFKAGEPNNPKFEDGVMVLRDSRLQADYKCRDGEAPIPVDYNLADEHLPENADGIFYPDED